MSSATSIDDSVMAEESRNDDSGVTAEVANQSVQENVLVATADADPADPAPFGSTPAADTAAADPESSGKYVAAPTESAASSQQMNPEEKQQSQDPGSAATATSSENVDTTPSLRPWDFSNRKVMVQGVNKFHDVKTVTKSVNKWLADINTKKQVPAAEAAAATEVVATRESASITEPMAFDRIKKPPKGNWMVVTMKTEDMVQPFIDYINNSPELRSNKRGDRLFAKPAAAGDDEATASSSSSRRNDKRSNRDDETSGPPDSAATTANENQPSKRQRKMVDGAEVQNARRHITEDELKDKITPLWKLSAEEQLDTKMKDMIKKCAMKIIQEIKHKFRMLDKEKTREKVQMYPWVLQKRGISMSPIVSAPTPLRNKCEFTFGYRYLPDDTVVDAASETTATVPPTDAAATEPKKVPAVGFMVTGWAGGVSFSRSLRNIPSEAAAVVDIVDEFLVTSPLEPYDSKAHKGFWRILTMRTSRRTRECMIVIQHSPPASGGHGDDDSYDRTKEFETEKARLLKILTEAELATEEGQPPLKVTSVFFQEFAGLSNPTPDHPVQHTFGNTYLTETLGKCQFQISPGAFFQVNTEGAEILYQLVVDKVREVSDDPGNTLLFDVCCGTGTIGLTCMKEGAVGQVVGVDISEPAIANAQVNAGLNFEGNTETTRFVAARAEQVLSREIQKAKQQTSSSSTSRKMKFVAVVDPARDGLHAEVVKTLRANEQIGRLVYVSCNPTGSLIRDAAMLCAPPTKRYPGRPFQVVSATPVDMFPLTDHCEIVMTFDRLVQDGGDDQGK